MKLIVNVLKLKDANYPKNLSVIPNPPAQIYYAGSNLDSWLNRPKVAVIGSRKASAYGREVTAKITQELAAAGVVIISGLAYGIDSVAHETALKAGGITVAVLPTSLDKIYPASHVILAKRIVDGGGSLISEYSAEVAPQKAYFTARNRIVSGLADLILITEAALRSGTLNTTRFALEQGKTVAAVPGNITNFNSQGVNNLIKAGALPVTDSSDVFFALNIDPQNQRSQLKFVGSEQEEKVVNFIKQGVSSQEELALRLGVDGAEIGSLLTMLELNGYIKPTGAGHWAKV